MDASQRCRGATTPPTPSPQRHNGRTTSPKSSTSTWATAFYILHQILEVPTTIVLLAFGFILPSVRDWFTNPKMSKAFTPNRDIGDLQGRIVLVTGGNAGLGKQTIAYLAAHSPARIYLGARTESKARTAISDIRAAVPKACEIVHLPLDLMSFASIAEAAKTFTSRESRLDLLINNAGIMATPYGTTEEGFEGQLGTNHVGHALLTKLLLPTLLETAKTPGADVRIISLSSMGHHLAPAKGLEFDAAALQKMSTWRRYGNSKLANILYARELATRYPSITSVSVHPGVIVTDLYSSLAANFFLKICIWIYGYLARILPGHYKDTKGGALNQTWCATAPKDELENGAFFKPVGVKNAGSKWARDPGLQKKLWDWTEGELEKHGY